MKNFKSATILTLVFLSVFFIKCGEKDVTNPFDEGCPKELFTPAEFKSAMEGNAVKLSWTQANMQINGFVVNRSENDGTMAEVARIDKATKTWTDTKVAGGTKYNYQLFAYAGANLSNPLQSTITTPALGATVTTVSAASDITATLVTIGGNVSDDGGATVTERGICYSTSTNPTIANSKVLMGNGKGIFSGTITGLAANTTYYAKAFATNSYGTAYGSEISFKTTELLLPTVATATATSITAISAVLGGNVTSDGNATVTERGVCYSIIENPTTANSKLVMGNGTGTFSNTITGLTAGTTYYVRAYAINSLGTAYGTQISFPTTQLLLATVTTAEAANLMGTTATLGGSVTNDGNSAVTERGVCYSTNQNPTINNTKVSVGTGIGTFNTTITGLTSNTTYYLRAYAINSQGIAYGNELSFKTVAILSLPSLITSTPANITVNSVLLGGNVTKDGDANVTERGVCYSTNQNPTTNNNKVVIGIGTGTFGSTITGLSANTTFYVRAYAINSQGTAYGSELNFKTGAEVTLASLTTSVPVSITDNSAVLGGNISGDGYSSVTERGICYSTTQNPTISNNKIPIGTGIGAFSNTITGLTTTTTYYVRAYAINSVGIAYGNEVSFSSLGKLPTISTKDATSILETSAIVGGIVISDEGSPVTERGVCYSTSANPNIYDSKIASGSGLGVFNIPLNTLIPNITYYLRAYATNKNGTAYGENKTFKTLDAYYAGFENGIPAGWSGMWTTSSDSPYEGFYCLKSVNVGDSIKVTLNITSPAGGQVSFVHRASGGGISSLIHTQFYIDNILQTTILDEGWTTKTFTINSGTHRFMWRNNGGGYQNNITYIDYFICPK